MQIVYVYDMLLADKMPLFSMCVVEAKQTTDAVATTFQIPDFRAEAMVSVAIGIGKNEVLRALDDNKLYTAMIEYIHSIHSKIPVRASQPADCTAPSVESRAQTVRADDARSGCGGAAPTDPRDCEELIRGGKTFLSTKRPVLFFLRYRNTGDFDDILEDLAAVMAIEAYTCIVQSTQDELTFTLMNMPKVMAQLDLIRARDIEGKRVLHLNFRGHEFIRDALSALSTSVAKKN